VDSTIINNRRLLLLLLSAAVLFGIIEGALGMPNTTPRPLHYIELLTANAITYLWFAYDAENRNYDATPLLKFSVVAFGVFAIFYYFIRSRRFPGCFKSFWFAFLLIVVSASVFALTGIIVDVVLKH
jgi:hypothetical protein